MSAQESDRLKALLAMAERQPVKPFTWYGIAMEYRSLGRIDDAVATFKKLIGSDPNYVAAYHQLGLMLRDAGRTDEARDALKEGVTIAERVGNGHAAGEMSEALDGLD